MIFRSVQLENFGLYAGQCEFNLVPRQRRGAASPIILIGGKNGAGKTTFLEGVRVALYGRRALGTRVGQSEYEKYLQGMMHRAADVSAAAVGVEFDYAEAGTIHRYRVRREWVSRNKGVVETLLLEKDGTPITAVPPDEWHHFLQELIPPGVSQLFFFDGEKIREIADGEEENEQLADAVRGLLGIELVGRLRTDLGLFIARHQRAEESQSTGVRLEEVLRDIAAAEQTAAALADEVAELTAQRESQARAAEQIRRRFVAEGGDAALHRTRTETEREQILRRIGQIDHDLRELANGLLPFAMAPRLVRSFQTALAQARHKLAGETLSEALMGWRAEANPPREANWSAKHWADLTVFVQSWIESAADAASPSAFSEVGDGASALARLAEVEGIVRPRAIALGAEMDELALKLREIETALARADTAAAGLLLDELRLADKALGATEATLKARQSDLKTARGQIITLERDRRRLLDTQAEAAAAADKGALAARTAKALADYEHRLLVHKLEQLRVEFVRLFNHLARKTDLIADVRIDPTTVATTLIDREGRAVSKAALSAGEKQIYAIAMLWALARISSRPLPMIIDTPLARLDTEHRSNLIERYFPAASHQVVLLSTDTEVDERLLAELDGSVSHVYRLDYDTAQGRTIVAHGYFESGRRAKETGRALQQA